MFNSILNRKFFFCGGIGWEEWEGILALILLKLNQTYFMLSKKRLSIVLPLFNLLLQFYNKIFFYCIFNLSSYQEPAPVFFGSVDVNCLSVCLMFRTVFFKLLPAWKTQINLLLYIFANFFLIYLKQVFFFLFFFLIFRFCCCFLTYWSLLICFVSVLLVTLYSVVRQTFMFCLFISILFDSILLIINLESWRTVMSMNCF